jgi:ABC-2 type transport system ATP-binding protein
MTLLRIEQISKEYQHQVWANDSISLSIQAGEVFGLLGPNGAGKTTLVNQIIGLVAPTSGRIILEGVDLVTNPGHARQACSFQPQSHAPIDGIPLLQAMCLIGQMRGGRADQVHQRAQELIDTLELGDWADRRGETLSGGVRRLAAFCMAVVMPGRLVILDEPTNDVDPLRRRLLWREVRTLADRGSAVLLVTHNVLEAERSVDRLAVLDQGKVVGVGTPASLREPETGHLRLELILEPTAQAPVLPAFLSQPVNGGRRMIARVEAGLVSQAAEWAQTLKDKALVEEFSLRPVTLEDVYVRLIGRADALEI